MAKKVISGTRSGQGKNFVKCIKTVKSSKTGAYFFEESVIHLDNVKEYFEN